MSLTFGSLFAGIGGFDLGFERAGMTCKWQVEIDDYATRVLEKHWPTVHRERDIKQCGKHNLERVDVICGGFPCQDISYAGLGAGLDGERSGLFFEAVRVVSALQPSIVVLENVSALLARGLDRVLGTLAEIGFNAEWHCLQAADFGAPHIRDRVFIIANSNRRRFEEFCKCDGEQETRRKAQQRSNTLRLREVVADSDCKRCERREDDRSFDAKAFISKARQAIKRDASWETEPSVGRVVDGFPGRVDRLRGLGNAVVPQVAEYIGRCIVASFERNLPA